MGAIGIKQKNKCRSLMPDACFDEAEIAERKWGFFWFEIFASFRMFDEVLSADCG